MPGPFVVATAQLQCSFGAAPSALLVTSNQTTLIGNLPAATIMDFAPMTNIPPFGMCTAPTNPAVIAATSAALGVFTPAPCVPAITAPWTPGKPTVLIGNKPALTATCKCMCAWAGVISVINPGQGTTTG